MFLTSKSQLNLSLKDDTSWSKARASTKSKSSQHRSCWETLVSSVPTDESNWNLLRDGTRWRCLWLSLTQRTPAVPLVHLKQKLGNNACTVVCCHGYWRLFFVCWVFFLFFCKLNPPRQRDKPRRDDSSRCWGCWTDEFSSGTLRELITSAKALVPQISLTQFESVPQKQKLAENTDRQLTSIMKTCCSINDEPL